MYNPFSLEGKTILVTGASSGIGRATAIECSRMGAKVIITARNEERLKEPLEQLDWFQIYLKFMGWSITLVLQSCLYFNL